MTPYYEQDGITIYHGDCREVLPSDARFDAIVTDPPYGIGYKSNHNSGRTGEWAKWCRDENFDSIAGDDGPFDPKPWVTTLPTVFFGANYFADKLPPSRCWVTWDKRDGMPSNDFADCEMIWTNFDKPSRVYRHLWSGLVRAGRENVAKSVKWHPHQKPEALLEFMILYGQIEGVIFDPYMGSGTTLVAAKRLGRRAIGIEIEERYCEIAAKRLVQGALPLEFGA